MEEKQTVIIVNEYGKEEEVELVDIMSSKDQTKEYMIYRKLGSKTPQEGDMVELSVVRIKNTEHGLVLEHIANEEEWREVEQQIHEQEPKKTEIERLDVFPYTGTGE